MNEFHCLTLSGEDASLKTEYMLNCSPARRLVNLQVIQK